MVGPEDLMIVGVVVIVLFGGKKIPELMRGVGQGLGEFRRGVEEAKYNVRKAIDDEVERAHEQAPAPKQLPEAAQPADAEPHPSPEPVAVKDAHAPSDASPPNP